jgi:cell division protein FtsB
MGARSGDGGAGRALAGPSTRGRRLVETAFRRKALGLAAFVIVAATVLNSFFGERGILGLWKAREEYESLLREVEHLEAENESLSAQIHALRHDPLVVERLARETLGMAREGEIVLTIRRPGPR